MSGDWRQVRLTGIMFHPGRLQPWTVWRKGYVLHFCEEKAEAVARLARAEWVGVK